MQQQTLTFDAIGTRWTIQAQTELSAEGWGELEARVQTRIEEFDGAYSRFRTDSLVTRMSQQAGTYELPSDGYELLSFYEKLNMLSNGKVTPLIGQVMVDVGYDADYSLQAGTLRTPPAWQDVISYDKHSLTVTQPALLDFGAAGKGYLVDIISDVIADAGIQTYFINAGGDIVYRSKGRTRLNVGLENPRDHTEVIGTASILNQSICASSGSRRAWGKYHHIIDPSTLESPQDIIATWVVADTAMVADGLATALYFVAADALRGQFDFDYAILRDDMSLEYSHNFPTIVHEVKR